MKRRFKLPFVAVWPAPRAYAVLAVAALLLAAGGAFTPAEWAGLALLALCVIAIAYDLFGGAHPGALHVVRERTETFALRRPAVLRYHVQNRSRGVLRAGIVESPSPLLFYPRDELRALLAPHTESTLEREAMPVARGTGELTAFYVWHESALGFVRRRRRIAQADTIQVYPDLSAVERYGNLRVRNRIIESGLRRMRLRGTGTEIENLREWGSGDAFRAINWSATARRGHLMVTEFEVERSQNVMVLLDAGRLMTPWVGDQRKFDYAITAALSVAAIASLASDRVGFVAFAGEILRARAPRPAARSASTLMAELHDLEPRFEESDYGAAFAYLRTHVRKRSLVLFFTDVIDPAAQTTVLSQLSALARRHVVLCAFMNDAAIETALAREPRSDRDVYEMGVALELRDERRTAAATLERAGVQVVDVPARELSVALIDRYLRIKQRGLL